MNALDLYEHALGTAEGGPALSVRFGDGTHAPFPVTRYLASADGLDHSLLATVSGPVLDVGCGPGRHLRALNARGVEALGIDLSPAAIAHARCDGANALVGDIFGEVPVPAAGAWATALLLDGNIGIGGCPRRLLTRLHGLLAPAGAVLAEVEAPEAITGSTRARIESGLDVSGWFPWARVSISELADHAAAADMVVEESWQVGERWFARLRVCPPE